MSEKQKIINWLKEQDPEFAEPCFHPRDLDGPNEVSISKNGSWSISYESRSDEIYAKGRGLEALKKYYLPHRRFEVRR